MNKMVGDVMVLNEERNGQTQRNWLARFTGGLSSSLARFGAGKGSGSSSPVSSLPEEPRQLFYPHKTFIPPSVLPDNCEVFLSGNGSNESRIKDGSSMPFPMPQASQMGSSMGQSRQRLAGHLAKIRLETPPVPETPSLMVRQQISDTPRELLDISSLSSFPVAPARTETDIRFPMANAQLTSKQIESSYLLTSNDRHKTEVGTQKHLPIGHMFKGNVRVATRNPLWGSGEFSCGQRDVVVKNPAVRASSVILVTLTSNPGPVVVHYVSLLPYESFTVHLTAPTTAYARFNYLLLGQE